MASRKKSPPRKKSSTLRRNYDALCKSYRGLEKNFIELESVCQKFYVENRSLLAVYDKTRETLDRSVKNFDDISAVCDRLSEENQKLHADLLRVAEGRLMDVAFVAIERARSVPGHKPS